MYSAWNGAAGRSFALLSEDELAIFDALLAELQNLREGLLAIEADVSEHDLLQAQKMGGSEE